MLIKEFFSHVNWLAVVVGAVAYFLLGAIWYSKVLFVKPWMEGHKIQMTDQSKEEAKKKLPMLMIMTFLLNFGIVLGVALLDYALKSPNCVSGIKIGLFASVAFSAATLAINYMYTSKSFKLILIDGGYHVVGITLASIIVSVWHMH